MARMSESGDVPEVDDRLPRGGRSARPCEFERAYQELVEPRKREAQALIGPCSDSGAEERVFPPSPTGRPYSLCNGHLRDLFGALDNVRAEESLQRPGVAEKPTEGSTARRG